MELNVSNFEFSGLQHFEARKISLKNEKFIYDIINPNLICPKLSDRIKDEYEGGGKTWECTFDLIDFLESEFSKLKTRIPGGLRILELGCGSALVSQYLVKYHSVESLCLQDFNKSVLEAISFPNSIINKKAREARISSPKLSIDIDHSFVKQVFDCLSLQLIYGDWQSLMPFFTSHPSFDIIVASEVLYESANYQKLHDLICVALRKPIFDTVPSASSSYCIIASKSVYFGFEGSVSFFKNFVDQCGRLTCQIIPWCRKGIFRDILLLTWLK